MTAEEESVLLIKGVISELSVGEQEQCYELIDHFRRMVASAGIPVGILAFTLVGAELQSGMWVPK